MRIFRYVILFLALAFVVASCNDDDDYSLDKYWLDMATVNDLTEDEAGFYLTLDDGTNLFIASPLNVYKPKTKRVFANYTILGDLDGDYDYAIRLNGIQGVLTKDIIYINPTDDHKQDSIGKDPIKILSMKEGGGYLNVKFEYNGGGEKSHFISVVSDDEDLSVGDAVVKLELRHNQNGDPQRYPASSWACFDLKPYQIDGKETTFEISALDFDGTTVTKTIKYKYDE